MHTTSRLALSVPDGTDNVSSAPANFAQAFGVLDGALTFSQGTLAARLAPSLAGRVYYATDTGLFYVDTGSVWASLALQPGAWQGLSLASNIGGGGYPGVGVAARLEFPTTVRLTGTLTNNTGGSDSSTLATLPSALRPTAGTVYLNANEVLSGGSSAQALVLQVTTGGAISSIVGFGVGAWIPLDGLTFTTD